MERKRKHRNPRLKMNNSISKLLGGQAEYLIACEMYKNNITCSKPYIDEGVDLILIKENISYNIQVKSTTSRILNKNGIIEYMFSFGGSGKSTLRKYDNINFFAFVCYFDEYSYKIFYVKQKDIIKDSFSIRLDINKQVISKKRVRVLYDTIFGLNIHLDYENKLINLNNKNEKLHAHIKKLYSELEYHKESIKILEDKVLR